MGLYNFQKRFIEYIQLGLKQPDHPHSKLHTIRARRKREDKPGDTMHLYEGLRHPGARLIARVPCVAVRDITIRFSGVVHIDGDRLSESEADQLALRDGFPEGHTQMMQFWWEHYFSKLQREVSIFEGRIYHWGVR